MATKHTATAHDQWKPVIGWERTHEISIDGDCRRIGSHKLLAKNIVKGYILYNLQDAGRKRMVPAHRMVLAAFVGPCPSGHVARHLDGTRDNNHVSNLRWGTVQENVDDRGHHGRNSGGGRGSGLVHLHRKLTDDQIRAIRADRRKLREIASEYGVAVSTVWAIRRRASWASLA